MLIYKPSLLAASAMFLANRIIKKDRGIWTEELVEHSTYTESQLRCCAKDMCILIAGIEKCSLQTVRKKFSLTRYNQVATIKIEHWMALKTVSDQWMTQIRETHGWMPCLLSLIVPYTRQAVRCLPNWRRRNAMKPRTTPSLLFKQDWPISWRVLPSGPHLDLIIPVLAWLQMTLI